MYPDALSDSLSRLCDETGLTYEAASRRCHCSSQSTIPAALRLAQIGMKER